jgi:citronellyl-CoA dehydrogenase
MQLTHEHNELRRTYLRIIRDEINPHVDEWEEAGIFPAHEVFKKLGDAGLLGVNKPVDYGGLGLDFSYSAVVAETAWQIDCGGIPMAIGVQTDMATPALARFGSPELRAEYLAPAISGDAVACLGVSEPHAGSDVAAIRSKARRDGDDYVIDGTKMWITNGSQADWMCMLVNTSDAPSHRNKSLIVVPLRDGGKQTPGVTIARRLKKLGMRSSDTAEIFFEGVRVPARNLIGEEGQGFTYQMLQFQEERMFAALGAIATCERTLAETIEYTRQRKAFGRSILDNQAVQFRLSELLTEAGGPACDDLAQRRGPCRGRGLHPARLDGEVEGHPPAARGQRRLPAILGRDGLYG